MSRNFERVVKFAGRQLEKSVVKISDKIDDGTKKFELVSKIGDHERIIKQNYQKLGEAFYNSKVYGTNLDSIEPLIDVIKANKQVVDLLNDQLKRLK